MAKKTDAGTILMGVAGIAVAIWVVSRFMAPKKVQAAGGPIGAQARGGAYGPYPQDNTGLLQRILQALQNLGRSSKGGSPTGSSSRGSAGSALGSGLAGSNSPGQALANILWDTGAFNRDYSQSILDQGNPANVLAGYQIPLENDQQTLDNLPTTSVYGPGVDFGPDTSGYFDQAPQIDSQTPPDYSNWDWTGGGFDVGTAGTDYSGGMDAPLGDMGGGWDYGGDFSGGWGGGPSMNEVTDPMYVQESWS